MQNEVHIIDTETTGLSNQDQVLELAIVTMCLESGKTTRWGMLIRPTCPVSIGARAVHHILDEELNNKQTTHQLMADDQFPLISDASAVVAHNYVFDERLLLQSGIPETWFPTRKICTLKCARHLWPEAPSHSNQALRYYLQLEVPAVDGPPHRAMPDAVVTAELFRRMLDKKTVDELAVLSGQPALLSVVTFGKYASKPWSEMDVGFLGWVLGRDFNDDVRYTAQHWLKEKRK